MILPDADARIEEIARAYRRGGAAAISVVIEQDFFGGDPAWLPRVKAASGLPVLMKDFVVDEAQLEFAVSLGADAVLLIAAALDDARLERLYTAACSARLAVLVEAHDEAEIRRAAALGAGLVGVNARNLATFEVDRVLRVKPPAELEPVHARQHDIQDDRPVLILGGQPQALRPVGRDVDRVALLLQGAPEQPGHPDLVFHHKHPHAATLCRAIWRKAEQSR